MLFNPDLPIGSEINNNQLCKIFKCSSQGGMRRSNVTNSLVIVSNHVESIYDDRWIDNVLHYTGMGRKGDQSLLFMQNKTLTESNKNGVQVFLFEVFHPKLYTYRGQVKLTGKPYSEMQPDVDGKDRLVWMFSLHASNTSGPLRVLKEDLDKTFKTKQKQASKLSTEELRQRAKHAHKQAGKREVTTTQYERSPWVSEYAKRLANGICDLCNKPAPFKSKDGSPYLETHHIVWLAKGGEDTIGNTVALCPNCHRKMHMVNSMSDMRILEDRKKFLKS